jgi:hypothetical protein
MVYRKLNIGKKINFVSKITMKKLFYLLTPFIPLWITAQSIPKQVLTSLGANLSNSKNKLSNTSGEIIIGHMLSENGSVQLGNGYYPSLNLETLSIESQKTAISVRVYPNPVSELFYISHPTETDFDIYLFDLTGKILFETKIQKQDPININHYPKGVYLLRITSSATKKTNTYKIIKL